MRTDKPKKLFNQVDGIVTVQVEAFKCTTCNRICLDKRQASYCCATHVICEDCGQEAKGTSYTVCSGCSGLRDDKRWRDKKVHPWNGEFPIFDGDTLIFDAGQLHDHIENLMEENECETFTDAFESCRFELCDQIWPCKFDVDDWVMRQSEEISEFEPSTIKGVEEHVVAINKAIAEQSGQWYQANGKRIDPMAILKVLDWAAGSEKCHDNVATHAPTIPCGINGELRKCPTCGAAEVELEMFSCGEYSHKVESEMLGLRDETRLPPGV